MPPPRPPPRKSRGRERGGRIVLPPPALAGGGTRWGLLALAMQRASRSQHEALDRLVYRNRPRPKECARREGRKRSMSELVVPILWVHAFAAASAAVAGLVRELPPRSEHKGG